MSSGGALASAKAREIPTKPVDEPRVGGNRTVQFEPKFRIKGEFCITRLDVVFHHQTWIGTSSFDYNTITFECCVHLVCGKPEHEGINEPLKREAHSHFFEVLEGYFIWPSHLP